jgi:hypothetical protein
MLQKTDEDFDIPFGQDDDWIECGLDDERFGPAESWPSSEEIDGDRWCLTEAIPDPDTYDEWLTRVNEINQADDRNGPISDQDLQASGLPVG